MSSYRVIQTEIDSTAAIVWETAELARDSDEYVNVYLEHLEDPHVNLGLIERPVPDLDPDLQFRRWGGGGTVYHDGTQCFMRAKSKAGPKEELESERDAMASLLLDELEKSGYDTTGFYDAEVEILYEPGTGELIEKDSFSNTAYFDTSTGDIYEARNKEPNSLFDPQIVGIGVADFGDVVVSRGCMYPEEPIGVKELRDDYDKWVNGVKVLEEDIFYDMMDRDTPVYLDESQFASEEAHIMGRMIQRREGLRDQYDCF